MLGAIIKYLRPPHMLDVPEADPALRKELYEARLRGWYYRINHVVLGLVVFAGVVAFALTPSGIVMLGSIAWADDVNSKIESAVKPIQTAVDAIATQTKEIKEQQKARELADLRQKLFETRIAQCKARSRKQTEEGNPYTKRMDELQLQHFNLTQTYFQAADCDDL